MDSQSDFPIVRSCRRGSAFLSRHFAFRGRALVDCLLMIGSQIWIVVYNLLVSFTMPQWRIIHISFFTAIIVTKFAWKCAQHYAHTLHYLFALCILEQLNKNSKGQRLNIRYSTYVSLWLPITSSKREMKEEFSICLKLSSKSQSNVYLS